MHDGLDTAFSIEWNQYTLAGKNAKMKSTDDITNQLHIYVIGARALPYRYASHLWYKTR